MSDHDELASGNTECAHQPEPCVGNGVCDACAPAHDDHACQDCDGDCGCAAITGRSAEAAQAELALNHAQDAAPVQQWVRDMEDALRRALDDGRRIIVAPPRAFPQASTMVLSSEGNPMQMLLPPAFSAVELPNRGLLGRAIDRARQLWRYPYLAADAAIILARAVNEAADDVVRIGDPPVEALREQLRDAWASWREGL